MGVGCLFGLLLLLAINSSFFFFLPKTPFTDLPLGLHEKGVLKRSYTIASIVVLKSLQLPYSCQPWNVHLSGNVMFLLFGRLILWLVPFHYREIIIGKYSRDTA